MKTAREVLADWANNARAPLRLTTCENIADGIVKALHAAGYVIIKDRTDPEGGIPGRKL